MPIHTAIFLAAGAGTKFWPYNVVRNKTAFPIANVPAVRRLADQVSEMGIERLIVVIGHSEASVRAALRGCAANIQFVRQPQAMGTADAVMQCAPLLDGDFLVLAGDIVTDGANLTALMERFEAERPMAAAMIQPLGDERPNDWLVAHVEGDRLSGIEGHPRDGKQRLCGAYAMRAEAVGYLRDNPGIVHRVPVGGMPPVESEIAQSLQMMIDERVDVLAVETTGCFVDLDKPWHILEANHQIIDAMSQQITENIIPASACIHDGAEIEGKVVLGENAVIGNRVVVRGNLWMGDNTSVTNGAIIEGSAVIGTGTKVRDYCQIGGQSTLGARGVYGHGAEFSGVSLNTVYCYHYCEIWGVVGEAVDFGAATVCGNLRFDDGESPWRIKGRRETPTHASNAAYFGDFSRTGVNAIIMPGRRTGVYSVVGPGVVLYEDLPDRQLTMVKQELTTSSWGPERYGW